MELCTRRAHIRMKGKADRDGMIKVRHQLSEADGLEEERRGEWMYLGVQLGPSDGQTAFRYWNTA